MKEYKQTLNPEAQKPQEEWVFDGDESYLNKNQYLAKATLVSAFSSSCRNTWRHLGANESLNTETLIKT